MDQDQNHSLTTCEKEGYQSQDWHIIAINIMDKKIFVRRLFPSKKTNTTAAAHKHNKLIYVSFINQSKLKLSG